MFDAELLVCTDCGAVHVENDDGPAPRDLEVCGACDGDLGEVDLDDIVGL
jgi:hypothetical protein